MFIIGLIGMIIALLLPLAVVGFVPDPVRKHLIIGSFNGQGIAPVISASSA